MSEEPADHSIQIELVENPSGNAASSTTTSSSRRLIANEEEDEEENANSEDPARVNLDRRRRELNEEARRLIEVQPQSQTTVLHIANVWRRGNFVFILYFIPLTVALVTVLIVDWNKQCDKPLKEWAATQVCLQVLLLLVNFIVLNKLPQPDEPADVQQRRLRSLTVYHIINRILNLVWFIWFIVGMVWTFEAMANNTCSRTAPFLFRMCYALIIIQLVLIGLIVLFCCCSCLIVFLRLFIYPPGTIVGSRGATESTIKALPCKKFETGLLPAEDANCAICLSDYEVNDDIRYLPCNHHFHSGCVDQWLLTNKSCPFCKREIDSPPPPKSSPTVTVTV